MGHYDSCRPGYCARCGAAPGNIVNGRCGICHPGPAQLLPSESVTSYIAGSSQEFFYPRSGDPLPPRGAKCLLLTRGGVCVVGMWGRNDLGTHYLGWAPLPRRNKEKEDVDRTV